MTGGTRAPPELAAAVTPAAAREEKPALRMSGMVKSIHQTPTLTKAMRVATADDALAVPIEALTLRDDLMDAFAPIREAGATTVATNQNIISQGVAKALQDSQLASLGLTILVAGLILVLNFWTESRRPMLGVITIIPVVLIVLLVFGVILPQLVDWDVVFDTLRDVEVPRGAASREPLDRGRQLGCLHGKLLQQTFEKLRIDSLPIGANGAHDDGVVEEDVGQQDGPDRVMQADRALDQAGPVEHRLERGCHHDGG